eukprot:343370_1
MQASSDDISVYGQLVFKMAVESTILAGDFVVLFLSIFGVILNVIYLISIAKQMCNKQSTDTKTKDGTMVTNVSILSITFYFIFCIMGVIAWTKLIFMDEQHGNVTTTRMFRIGAVFYVFTNNGLLLFILLIRMNHLSIYPLYYKKITYILPIITVIMVTVPFTLSILDTNAATISHSITIMMTMIVIIIYIILLVMYLKQIHFVMKQRVLSSKNKTENTDDNQVSHEVIIDLNTIQNSVRYSVLTIFCVSSTLSVPVWTSIGVATVRHPSFISFLAGTGLMIDGIVNSMAIFFLFGFVKPFYFKICNPCHGCVRKCCISSVVKSFKGDPDKEKYEALILAE